MALIGVVVFAATAAREGYAHRDKSVLEQLDDGLHPRFSDEQGRSATGLDPWGSVAVVAIEPVRCDQTCRVQRQALRQLSGGALRDGVVVRLPMSPRLSNWLGNDKPVLLAVSADGRIVTAIPRAAGRFGLQQAVRAARSHPSGVALSWPR